MKSSTEASLAPGRIAPAPDGAAIVVECVSKTYPRGGWLGLRSSAPEGHYALREVSFTIGEGEMVGLLGPNGAGKTTLLKSIATLLSISSGRIFVYGRDIVTNPTAARRASGLVTCDERSFYWRLSGRQNLRFFAALYRVPDDRAAARIGHLLDLLGLSRAADQPYRSYSTGMRQKLAIARGLLAEPRLVLYDEPTRSLDPISAHGIREWIAASRLVSPTTTHVIATNQLHEAEQLCGRVLILNRGKLIADGSIGSIREQIHSASRMTHRITFLGARELNLAPAASLGVHAIERESAEDGAVTVRISTSENGAGLSAVLAQILAAGGVVVRCETSQAPFEEVFRSLIQEGASATGEGR